MLGFLKGEKPEYPKKNPRNMDENQQQTQPTCGTRPESKTDHIGGKQVLSQLRHSCMLSALNTVQSLLLSKSL